MKEQEEPEQQIVIINNIQSPLPPEDSLRAINLYGVTDFHRKSYNFKVT